MECDDDVNEKMSSSSPPIDPSPGIIQPLAVSAVASPSRSSSDDDEELHSEAEEEKMQGYEEPRLEEDLIVYKRGRGAPKKYCICRPSVSQKIPVVFVACENNKEGVNEAYPERNRCRDTRSHGWFHLSCMQLASVPEGPWWCPMCEKAGRKPRGSQGATRPKEKTKRKRLGNNWSAGRGKNKVMKR